MKKSHGSPNKNFIIPKKQFFKGRFNIDVDPPSTYPNKTPTPPLSQPTPVRLNHIFGSEKGFENFDRDRQGGPR
jgi:hypothetical protein